MMLMLPHLRACCSGFDLCYRTLFFMKILASLNIYWGKFAKVRQGLGCLYISDRQSLAFASDSQVPGQDELSWKVLPVA